MSFTVVKHPLVRHKVTLLRESRTSISQFRRLSREITSLLTYEATREMSTETVEIETWQGKVRGEELSGKKITVVPILRAGLGMLDGVLDLIPSARVNVVGLYRDEETLQPVEYYKKFNKDLKMRDTLVLDPMLATGHSMGATVDMILKEGCESISVICLVSAPEGVQFMTENYPNVRIFSASLDDHLNEDGYIIPGLGDAGDRLFGTR